MKVASSLEGFTLIELLIVIAVIGILAISLMPNLFQARERAFDSATQNCLKSIAVEQHAVAAAFPFKFMPNFDPHVDLSTVKVCKDVVITSSVVTEREFKYVARHTRGRQAYVVSTPGSVIRLVTP